MTEEEEDGGARAGVRSLTVGLAVALVLFTAAACVGYQNASCDAAVTKTKDAGDSGIAALLSSGESNVREIARQMMMEAANGVGAKISALLGRPESIVNILSTHLRAFPPNVTSSAHWLEQHIRPMMYHMFRVESQSGVTEVSMQTDANSWFMFFQSSLLSGGADQDPSGGMPSNEDYSSVECFNGRYNGCGAATDFKYGTPTDMGMIIDEPCDPDVQPGDRNGACGLPASVGTSMQRDSTMLPRISRAYETDEPNKLFWGPIEAKTSFLGVSAGATWAHLGYEKSGGRIGYIWAGCDVLAMSAFIRKIELPTGSRLYVVQTSPWGCKDDMSGLLRFAGVGCGIVRMMLGCDGDLWDLAPNDVEKGTLVKNECPISCDTCGDYEITREGTLVGASHGDAFEEVPLEVSAFGDKGLHDKRPLKATDSTDVIIAAHAKSVKADGHLFSDLSVEGMTDWHTPAGELLWQVVRVLSDPDAGLLMYVILLVPRDSALAEIDAATLAVTTKIKAEQKAVDEERASDQVTMFIAIAGMTAFLLGASVFFAIKITAPLKRLATDMEAVAAMKLDRVDEDEPLSKLSEVRSMEKSFRQMVINLREYRNFMPQSILVNADSDSDEDDVQLFDNKSNPDENHQGLRDLPDEDEHQSPRKGTIASEGSVHAVRRWKLLKTTVTAVKHFKHAPWENLRQVPRKAKGQVVRGPRQSGARGSAVWDDLRNRSSVPSEAGHSLHSKKSIRARASRASRASRARGSRARGSVSSQKRRDTPPSMKTIAKQGLSLRQAALVAANVRGFLTMARALSIDDLVRMHSHCVESQLMSVKSTKGIADGFCGDRFSASWNAVKPDPQSRNHAVQSAVAFMHSEGVHALNEFLEDNCLSVVRVSSGVATGGALCGNMGCEGMKKFAIVGGVAAVVHEMQALATALGSLAVLDAGTHADTKVAQVSSCRLFAKLSFPKRQAEPLEMWECTGPPVSWGTMDDDACGIDHDPWEAFTEAMRAHLTGRQDRALQVLQQAKEAPRPIALDQALDGADDVDAIRFRWAERRMRRYAQLKAPPPVPNLAGFLRELDDLLDAGKQKGNIAVSSVAPADRVAEMLQTARLDDQAAEGIRDKEKQEHAEATKRRVDEKKREMAAKKAGKAGEQNLGDSNQLPPGEEPEMGRSISKDCV